MGAEDVPITIWAWECDECEEGSEVTFDTRAEAIRAANEHNDEHHQEDK